MNMRREVYFVWDILFLQAGWPHLKNVINKKCEAMRNLHYLKNMALDAFENLHAELKNDGKDENWFAPLRL